MNIPKKRVKCANCGAIYDILCNPCDYGIGGDEGCCPNCKSNAYDEMEYHNWKKD